MYDSTEMYELGNAFLNVADTCFVEGKIKNRSEYQNVAGVVNLAFAAEIYLKCLLNINGKQIRGHKLFELWNEFKNINSQEAKDIENAVLDQIVTDFSFDDMLKNNSDAFYNYRYFYDPDCLSDIKSNPLRLNFLRFFTIILQQGLKVRLSK